MRNIAAQAGVGVGNLYNYFPSKDDLFCTVLSPIVSSFYAMFNRHHGEYVDVPGMGTFQKGVYRQDDGTGKDLCEFIYICTVPLI